MLNPEEAHSLRATIARVAVRGGEVLAGAAKADQALRLVGVLHQGIDAVFAQAATSEHVPVCRAGCTYCCNSVRVEASVPEALQITAFVRTLPEGQQAELHERLVAQRARPADVPRQPCAFLQEQRCSIYAVRPAVCRKAHSLDVEPCASGASHIPQNLDLILQSEALILGVRQAFEEHRLSAQAQELSVAVLQAMQEPEALAHWFLSYGAVSNGVQASDP